MLHPHLAGLWSICLGFCADDATATDELITLRARLTGDVRRLDLDRPFGSQLYALLYRQLRQRLEPADGPDIQPPVVALGRTPRGQEDSAELIRAAVRAAPPRARLLYLFQLVTELGAARLAALLDEPEQRVRDARTLVTARIHEALSQ